MENFTEQKCCLTRERPAKSENSRGFIIRWISRTAKQNIEKAYQTFQYKCSKAHLTLQPSQVCLTPLSFNCCQKIRGIFTKDASSAPQPFHFIVGCIPIRNFTENLKKVKDTIIIWLYGKLIRMQLFFSINFFFPPQDTEHVKDCCKVFLTFQLVFLSVVELFVH